MKGNKKSNQQGFTLIELSIVLVIIGLIVGGVLVGQDLIKAAQLRATVSQVEKYNTAVNTFRNKYNGIPGDLLNGANFFGAAIVGQTPATVGYGDGDGLVTGKTLSYLDGEPTVFWYELSAANLIGDPITAPSGTYTTPPSISTSVLPQTKIGQGTSFAVTSDAGRNYFIVGIFDTTKTTATATVAVGLTPVDAYQMDVKLDDGNPATGTVLSIGAGHGGIGTTSASTATAGTCYAGAASTAAYEVASHPTDAQCVIGIRASF